MVPGSVLLIVLVTTTEVASKVVTVQADWSGVPVQLSSALITATAVLEDPTECQAEPVPESK